MGIGDPLTNRWRMNTIVVDLSESSTDVLDYQSKNPNVWSVVRRMATRRMSLEARIDILAENYNLSDVEVMEPC